MPRLSFEKGSKSRGGGGGQTFIWHQCFLTFTLLFFMGAFLEKSCFASCFDFFFFFFFFFFEKDAVRGGPGHGGRGGGDPGHGGNQFGSQGSYRFVSHEEDHKHDNVVTDHENVVPVHARHVVDEKDGKDEMEEKDVATVAFTGLVSTIQ